MIPRRPLLIAAAALALAGVVAGFEPAVAAAWPYAASLLLLAGLLDAVAALRSPRPTVERRLPSSLSLATWAEVQITARNASAARSLVVQIFDHYPQTFHAQPMPQTLVLPPRHLAEVAYRVRATERGCFMFPATDLRVASPLGLWWRRYRVSNAATVRVYPNYSTIAKLLTFQVDTPQQLTGQRLRPRRGAGTEFHQLRDYREGDGIRSIDWKATQRTARLIAREYQDERDQQVVFVLDAGRRMLAKDGELSHFDHTLNAMLMLSYVALRHGDAVGVMTLGPTRTWLPPRKGLHCIHALLNHVYAIQPTAEEVDYLGGATEIAIKQRRRSLVVLLTNVREEDTDDLVAAAGLLQRRHLLVLASLRESALDAAICHDVRRLDEALRYAGTEDYLEARRHFHDVLRARGIFVDDCLWDELPAAITQRYLAVKRAGML